MKTVEEIINYIERNIKQFKIDNNIDNNIDLLSIDSWEYFYDNIDEHEEYGEAVGLQRLYEFINGDDNE